MTMPTGADRLPPRPAHPAARTRTAVAVASGAAFVGLVTMLAAHHTGQSATVTASTGTTSVPAPSGDDTTTSPPATQAQTPSDESPTWTTTPAPAGPFRRGFQGSGSATAVPGPTTTRSRGS